MTDGDNTQQTLDARHPEDRVAECEPGCERLVTYCTGCVDDAVRWNAEAGLRLDAGVGR